MMVETKRFIGEGYSLAFDRFGTGAITLILLHGYGEDKSSFHPLMQALRNRFTCLAIDLPFHGETHWDENFPCTPECMSDLLQALLISEGVSKQPLSLLGYSLGGRIALSLMQLGQLPLMHAWLLASDGLSEHPLYWFATHTRWGNRFFKKMMEQPRPFLSFIQQLNRIGLIHATSAHLTNRYLDEVSTRKALYQRWTLLRRFRIQNKKLLEQVKIQQLQLTLVFGKKDRLINAKPGVQWSTQMPTHIQLHWIEGGHRLLHPQHLDSLLEIILR